MDQYLYISFLVGWTSIYQLFWCSPGVQGFDTLPWKWPALSILFATNKDPISKVNLEGFCSIYTFVVAALAVHCPFLSAADLWLVLVPDFLYVLRSLRFDCFSMDWGLKGESTKTHRKAWWFYHIWSWKTVIVIVWNSFCCPFKNTSSSAKW